MAHIERLAAEFSLRPAQVKAAVELLDAGNTIPFIARFRASVALEQKTILSALPHLKSLLRLSLAYSTAFPAAREILCPDLPGLPEQFLRAFDTAA